MIARLRAALSRLVQRRPVTVDARTARERREAERRLRELSVRLLRLEAEVEAGVTARQQQRREQR